MKTIRLLAIISTFALPLPAFAQTSGTSATQTPQTWSTAPWDISAGAGCYPGCGGVAKLNSVSNSNVGIPAPGFTVLNLGVPVTLSGLPFESPFRYQIDSLGSLLFTSTAQANGPGDLFLPTPKGNSSLYGAGMPATLRSALYRSLASEAGPDYRVDKNGCATLPGSSLRATFNARGAQFSRADAPMVNLHLVAYGRRGEKLSPVEPVAPRINGTRVSYDHDRLIEWWQVLAVGYEQGFTITQRPNGTGALTLALATNQNATTNGAGLAWGKLHYGDLVVTDADGKIVPAALKSDGYRILIAVNDTHAAYPLTIDPLIWIEEQKVSSSDGATDDQFGWSVVFSGTTAFIGAPNATVGGNSGQGAVYVFTESSGTWTETQKLTSSDGAAGDAFGISIALSGTTAIIGAPDTNTFQGAAYVFTASGGTWSQAQKLTANDGTQFNQFGWSVALEGSTAMVGSISATVGANSSQGAVYAFSQSGGSWSQAQKFSSTDGVAGDSFGWSVALDGSTALVGTGFVTVNGNEFQGAAYVFDGSSGTWSETQKLIASNGNSFDFFGLAVALSGNTALVGADGAATDGNPFSNQGVTYVFTNSSGTWSETQQLAASDGQPSDSFGASVAFDGSTAVIGATGVTVNGNDSQGAAYVFDNSGGTFIEAQKLIASDGGELDQFGWSAAVSGTAAFIGAYSATANGNVRQGAAYFYEQSGGDLQLTSAASKIGSFEIDLPLSGEPGVECRSGGANHDYTIVFTFNNALASVDNATTSCGAVKGIAIDGNDAHRLVVSLTGVACNEQYVTVSVTGVHDEQGNTLASADATMGLLLGDTTGEGIVDTADVSQTKSQSGQPVTSANFREDVNVDGAINASDINLVKAQSGTALPLFSFSMSEVHRLKTRKGWPLDPISDAKEIHVSIHLL